MPPSVLIFFNSCMSLFFCLLVGSSGIILYASSFSRSYALLMYSSLSITTRQVPLSGVNMTLLVSFFNSTIAFCSSFVILALGGWIFFRTAFTSALNSSASPWARFWKVCSTAAMYSPIGGHHGGNCKVWPIG